MTPATVTLPRDPDEHRWGAERCFWCLCVVYYAPTPLRYPPPNLATREHLVPKSHGGTRAPENIVVACIRCNNARGNKVRAWRPKDAWLRRRVGVSA